ncbi:MAG: NF038122 family metalloprotease [Planctomycetes bacterium]|nr:NF038122 family metalloprotease [Planctomycetota bacterium]
MRETLATIILLLLAAPAGAIDFNFVQQPGMPQEVVDGFVRAGELWQDLLNDDITVNLNIGFELLPPMVLGSTRNNRIVVTYTQFVNALGAQVQSADDTSAGQSLQAVPAFALLINRTSDNPSGSGSAQTFLDDNGSANNTTIRLPRANAKALGLLDATAGGSDASITFSSDMLWDFEPDDGIDADHFNFVFVAAHEIGHMLGFTSGVDVLDDNSPPGGGTFNSNVFTWVSAADIFRFSSVSVAQGAGTIDWAADNRPKFFAIDGGISNLGEFSRGVIHGDDRQASHWRDNQGLGLMDPTFAPGEVSQITNLDSRMFDVIGYELVGNIPSSVEADLRIAADTGFAVTYTVVVANDGPDAVSGATVANQVPGPIGDITWTCVASGGATCSSVGTGQINDIVNLPVGSSITYTVNAIVVGADNVASVAPPAGVNDPDLNNNTNTP